MQKPRAGHYALNLAAWRAEIGVAIALVALVAVFSATAQNFLSVENFVTLLQQTSVIAIIAVGMTMVIVTGEIDLSVGAQVGLAGTLFAVFTVQAGIPIALSALIVLAFAALVGMFTGVLRVVWGIPTFITTLGLLSALRGMAFYVSDGLTIGPMPRFLETVWYGELFGLPFPVWIMAVVIAIGWIVLSSMPFGRHLYAIGGDAETARRYGVKVGRLRITVMVIVQVLAALGGMMLVGRLNAGSPTVGELMELDVIAAVIVGGTVLSGGKGRIIGTVLGVFFVAVLRNGLVLNGIDPVIFLIAQGLVIILAVWWSMLRK
ncbi:ABC transporter permease [Chelativorans sp. AA-79]|uniref:ABC transporter permease n=1 Tax=Chelativorans sp. AA-79 TaxID=3028735 RepID=UPI0023F9C9ED|nr:ABC transporter permease [Chelativorans sp. AA-79]WEX07258.1 ABC transporter permease [Chelativorans sp. AA-79]